MRRLWAQLLARLGLGRSLPGRSLTVRLVITAAVWAVIVLAVGGAALSLHYRQTVMRQLDRELVVVLDTLSSQFEIGPDGRPFLNAPPGDPRFARPFSGRYFQVSAVRPCETGGGGSALLGSRSLWDRPLVWPAKGCPDALSAHPGEVQFVNSPGPDGQALRMAGMVVRLEGLEPALALYAAADRREALAEASRFTLAILASIAVLGAGLIAAIVTQVRIGLLPLQDLQSHLAEVRRGQRARLDGEYPREVAALTAELNNLLDHNHQVVERARTQVGNLAHALKTPLSVLLNAARAETGGASAGFAELVERQAGGMGRNIEHYLAQAHAAARAELLGARTPAAAVLEDLARTLRLLYGRRMDLDLEVEAEDGAVFRGERQDLEEMAGNLMENACKYGGGKVRVWAGLREGLLRIAVEDDGPGLDPQAREEALRRGRRLDETVPGQGLGLAIAADLAALYSGGLSLSESALGGLRAELTLPAAD